MGNAPHSPHSSALLLLLDARVDGARWAFGRGGGGGRRHHTHLGRGVSGGYVHAVCGATVNAARRKTVESAGACAPLRWPSPSRSCQQERPGTAQTHSANEVQKRQREVYAPPIRAIPVPHALLASNARCRGQSLASESHRRARDRPHGRAARGGRRDGRRDGRTVWSKVTVHWFIRLEKAAPCAAGIAFMRRGARVLGLRLGRAEKEKVQHWSQWQEEQCRSIWLRARLFTSASACYTAIHTSNLFFFRRIKFVLGFDALLTLTRALP